MTVEKSGHDAHAELFMGLRPLLFTVAYEIIGSATDADDVLQDSFIRWATVDLDDVADVRAYLAKTVTRQALNALRARIRRREEYVGPWLPEPIRIDAQDTADDVVLAESVSLAMLVVLESLAPQERVVFVLGEVFGFKHAEVADILDKSVASIRQTAHRAREHVQARRKRFEPVDHSRADEIITAFNTAVFSGEVADLLRLLAPEVVFTADGGGKAAAVRHSVIGAQRVARLLLGLYRIAGDDALIDVGIYNGMPGIAVEFGGTLQGVFALSVVDGMVETIYVIRNPEKLGHIRTPRAVARR